MNSYERVMAALSGEPVDRPAFSIWQHFHDRDATPESLARVTIDFVHRWQPDFVKHTPTGMYAVEDWGTPIRRYEDPLRAPERIRPTFETAAGWRDLGGLDVAGGALGRELVGIRMVKDGLADDVPLLMTIFSPLTLAFKIVGDRVVDDLRAAPDDLHAGLQTIASTMAGYMQAVRHAGADGVFFASQLSSSRWLTREEYAAFGEPYDHQVLEAWGDEGPVVLHLCGADVFFDLADPYPVHGVSWDHTASAPSLAEAMQQTSKGLVAGLDKMAFVSGPDTVRQEVEQALAATNGRRHILAPTCVVPSQASAEALGVVKRTMNDER
jgi:uroporphyrinogen decarboxylase